MSIHNQLSAENYLDNYPYRIVVKFFDRVTELPIEQLGSLLEELFPDTTIAPWLDSEEVEIVTRLVDEARERDESYEPPNFQNYAIITTPLEQEPEEMVLFIREWDQENNGDGDERLVEYVYIRPKPAPPPALTPDDETNISSQGYVEPHNPVGPNPTYGVDARYAWNNYGDDGGDGSGIKFIDVEQGWFLNHNDLPPAIPKIYGEDVEVVTDIPTLTLGERATRKAHGTRCLGIINAADNSALIMGLAPNAEAAVVSPWIPLTTPPPPPASAFDHDIPKALVAAIDNLNFGDVLLIEEQLGAPTSIKEPVELDPQNFNVIRLATALGIIVIAPAANGKNAGLGDPTNGAYDLDTRPQLGSSPPEFILNRTSLDFKDSMAIMVAGATQTAPHSRMTHTTPEACFVDSVPSNYGSRVDCFAWGQCVFTIGHESGNANSVSAIFDGTSSASAIIAGVVILIQGIAENHPNIGHRFSPAQMREILSDPLYNTTSPDSAVIGHMPDLGRLIPHYIEGVTPSDVYIRDNLTDNGDPHSGSISASPDVIVRADAIANPGAFSGTATINSNTLGSTVTVGEDHFIYVRVLNRGAAATGVMADVYYTLPICLQTPANWNYIGRTPSPTNVPTDTTPLSITVLDPIPWPWPGAAILPIDHYCFIAVIWSDDDPNPLPEPANIGDLMLKNMDNFRRLIRNNNNITWRNFNVELLSSAASTLSFNFLAAGWPNEVLPMQLEIAPNLPDGAVLWLEGPGQFMESIIEDQSGFEFVEVDRIRTQIMAHDLNQFREVKFPAEFLAHMTLTMNIPAGERESNYELFARQLYKGEEVGRITWHLVPRD